jgi:hypothetical protein
MLALMWAMTRLSKHFMMKVTKVTCPNGYLGHWDDGGLLDASGDYNLGQGQVEEVREDTWQLVRANSEHAARDTIWAGRFVSWLGYLRIVIVGTTSSIHFLMKPVPDDVYSLNVDG